MTAMHTDVETVVPTDVDPEEAQTLERVLGSAAHGTCARLVSADGEELVIPAALCAVLGRVVHELAAGNSVTIAPSTKQLTTQEAADVLQVSRPYVVRLLESGKIPFHKVGTHRRVELAQVLAYRDRQRVEREAAMDRLVALSLEANLDI